MAFQGQRLQPGDGCFTTFVKLKLLSIAFSLQPL